MTQLSWRVVFPTVLTCQIATFSLLEGSIGATSSLLSLEAFGARTAPHRTAPHRTAPHRRVPCRLHQPGDRRDPGWRRGPSADAGNDGGVWLSLLRSCGL